MNHLVFSKDRPMQLRAYLDSLAHNVNAKNFNSIILSPSYENYGEGFFNGGYSMPCVEALSFDRSLDLLIENNLVSKDHKYILFGCDDVVYVNPVCVDDAVLFLDENPDVLGFSFRIGTNTEPKIKLINIVDRFLAWDWRGKPSHWGYPFELMGTIYRTDDFIRIFNARKDQFKTPNCLESFGNHLLFGGADFGRHLACFNQESSVYAQDVNRVQDVFKNKTQGTDLHTAENLIQRYHQEYRIDWQSMQGISFDEPFLGHRFWKEVNVSSPCKQ